MKKKLLLSLGVVLAVYVVAWALAGPEQKLQPGDPAPAIQVTDIHGTAVAVPNARAKWTHVQFRRFAGCP